MSLLVRPAKRTVDQVEEPATRDSSYGRSRPSSESDGASKRPWASPRPMRARHGDSLSQMRSSAECQSSSCRQSPETSSTPPLHSNRKFDPNTSIVLAGMRGTGKSSLAVILATATGRRLVDADRYFQQATGFSRSDFKKEHSLAEYRRREATVMESMLTENQEGCVITCGPASMERNGERLLREYAATHPVILVLRDAEGMQSYLKTWDADKVRRFVQLSTPVYRACTNLEYFNVSEATQARRDSEDVPTQQSTPQLELEQRSKSGTPYLTLKRVQRDLLRFVARATGNMGHLARLDASFPLSSVPIETRTYTYVVSVPLSALLGRTPDMEGLESAADAVELDVDIEVDFGTSPEIDRMSMSLSTISHMVAKIRRNIIVPFGYHVNALPSKVDSPNSVARRSESDYLGLVSHGLRLAPDFVTVDLSYSDLVVSQIVASKRASRIIGHYSASQRSPQGWDDVKFKNLYIRAQKLGLDMVRLSQPAVVMDDNFAVQRFRHEVRSLPGSPIPLIAYNTGRLGRLSCCFNPILTPLATPLLPSPGRPETPLLSSVREAQEALYASFALDPMRFAVFGANVAYSLSPAMHNAAYKLCGMPHEYRIHESPSLHGLNELISDTHFGGASLGLPYKTEVIPLLHSMSTHARVIGAVNTLIPVRTLEDPKVAPDQFSLNQEKSRAGTIKGLHGDNTDWIGMCSCIRRGLSPANAVRSSSTGLVIGAGGMARAAVYSMLHLGVRNIFVLNRTVTRAEKLAEHFNCQELNLPHLDESNGKPTVHVLASREDPWPSGYRQPTIVVSGIPAHRIGDQPAPDFTLPSQWLESPTGGVVVDLAYKPLQTPLVKQMRNLSHLGWVALDGLDVLPEQGFAQFELFTGRRAPRRLMRTIVLEEYKGEDGQYDSQAIQSRLRDLDGYAT